MLALIQLLFTATWTIYVAFLPQLAAAAGIPKEQIVWVLMLDQAIFIVMDFALGVGADRVAAALRRSATPMIAITVASAVAFVLLPLAGASSALLLTLTVVWAATSSALRAPPMAMFGRYLRASAAPRFVFLSLLGIGLASALAPWLTARLRGLSPEVPFLLAGVGLVAAVLMMGWCERRLANAPVEERATTSPAGPEAGPVAPILFAAILLLAFGFQVHAFINSAPAYLRFAKAPDLEWLMGLFWIGFSFAIMLPGLGALQQARPASMLVVGAVAGALALTAVPLAPSLGMLCAAQLGAGAAWGLLSGYALSAAMDAGRTGHEGRFTGIVFALLATAALTRFSIVASGAHTSAGPAFAWVPCIAWAAALVLLLVARRPATGPA